MRKVGEELLRPAVELAFLVAAVGSRRKPPLAVPVSVRPYLRFQKLPENAFEAVRDAIDADEDFRGKIAAAADETTVGAAGLLWLRRPVGWDERLRTIADAASTAASSVAPVGRGNDRRMVAIERSLRESRAAVAVGSAEVASAARRLADADAAVARSERTRAGMEQEISGLQRKLARVVGERDALAQRLADRDAQEAMVDNGVAVEVPRVHTEPPPPHIDAAALMAHVVMAEQARDGLNQALIELRQRIAPARPQEPARIVQVPASSRSKPVRSHRAKRHRVRLPGGILADSVEAAKFLFGRRDVVHVVDGYNVAKLAYPAAALRDQREQLLDLTDEIHARFGADMLVMFDGADVGPVHAIRRRASVQFSPAGVTADDLIVSWLTAAPLDQAVAVVTSDRAIRDAAEMLGAHVVHAACFLAASGRRLS